MLLSSLNIKMGCVSLIGVWRVGVALWVPRGHFGKVEAYVFDYSVTSTAINVHKLLI